MSSKQQGVASSFELTLNNNSIKKEQLTSIKNIWWVTNLSKCRTSIRILSQRKGNFIKKINKSKWVDDILNIFKLGGRKWFSVLEKWEFNAKGYKKV